MIRQKAISVKLNYDVLEELELEARASGLPKNRLINLAITEYAKFMDTKRAAACYGYNDITKDIIENYVRKKFPGHTVRIDT